MDRQQLIEHWMTLAETVFWAEEQVSPEWTERLRAAKEQTSEDRRKLSREYLEAIATEIVSRTTDEEIQKLYGDES